MKIKMLMLALMLAPLHVFAETHVLLYKHHQIPTNDWKATATANSALIDPNGDGSYADSAWVSPSGAVVVNSNEAPSAPTFVAEAKDSNGDSVGTL